MDREQQQQLAMHQQPPAMLVPSPSMTAAAAGVDAPQSGIKRQANAPAVKASPAAKKAKKSGSQGPTKKKNRSPQLVDKAERQKAAANIQAVNQASGGKNDKAAALAAAILRGVTMRPSGKWQAQLYVAGKSRYIGVFDSREKAALAYEIAREKLKSEKSKVEGGVLSPKKTETAVSAARKAAFEGVSVPHPQQKKKRKEKEKKRKEKRKNLLFIVRQRYDTMLAALAQPEQPQNFHGTADQSTNHGGQDAAGDGNGEIDTTANSNNRMAMSTRTPTVVDGGGDSGGAAAAVLNSTTVPHPQPQQHDTTTTTATVVASGRIERGTAAATTPSSTMQTERTTEAAPAGGPRVTTAEEEKDNTARAWLEEEGFDPDDVRQADTYGRTPLLYFIAKGNITMVQYLLVREADCRKGNTDGNFPLFWAAAFGHLEILQLLSKVGGAKDDIRRVTRYGRSPLRIAFYNGHFDVVQWLILNGALSPTREDLDAGGIDEMVLRRDLSHKGDYDKRLTVLSWARDKVASQEALQAYLTTKATVPASSFVMTLQDIAHTLQTLRPLRARLSAFIAEVPLVKEEEEEEAQQKIPGSVKQ